MRRFIEQEIRTYPDNNRKRVPRGEKKGWPKNKFISALLLGITNLTAKAISDRTGISYSSTRIWGMEQDFRAAKQAAAERFAVFIDNAREQKPLKVEDVDPDFHLYSKAVRALVQIAYCKMTMPAIKFTGIINTG